MSKPLLIMVTHPKYWTLLPWIESCPCKHKCGGLRFTWLFIVVIRGLV